MRTFVLATGFMCASAVTPAAPPGVIAAHLRGSGEPVVEMVNNDTSRGERGHFYYANTCEDCVYKGNGCGCEPAVEYFACLTKHCHSADDDAFAGKCHVMSDKCSTELQIDCKGPETVCKTKFHQLSEGDFGIDVDVSNDNAYCGPHGVCIGKVRMTAHVHKLTGPKEAPAPVVTMGNSPAPAAASSPTFAVASPAPAVAPGPPMWVECGLPKGAKADLAKKDDWNLCQKAVIGGIASCDLPMFKELAAGGSKKGYCVLKDSKDGKRLTQPAMSQIINVHKKAAAAEKPEAPKPKAKEAEKPLPVEKKVKAAVKEVEKPEKEVKSIVTEASRTQDSDKLPWMVAKDERAAAKEAEDKAKAAEKKEEKKVEKKEEKEVKKDLGNQEGKLPWMQNKANDKAAPPGVEGLVGPK